MYIQENKYEGFIQEIVERIIIVKRVNNLVKKKYQKFAEWLGTTLDSPALAKILFDFCKDVNKYLIELSDKTHPENKKIFSANTLPRSWKTKSPKQSRVEFQEQINNKADVIKSLENVLLKKGPARARKKSNIKTNSPVVGKLHDDSSDNKSNLFASNELTVQGKENKDDTTGDI